MRDIIFTVCNFRTNMVLKKVYKASGLSYNNDRFIAELITSLLASKICTYFLVFIYTLLGLQWVLIILN